MKRLGNKLVRVAAVATAEVNSFVALARLAGLNPATAFRGADLRNVDFGTDNLAGFDFSFSLLQGANFSNATGLDLAHFLKCATDNCTKWPLSFSISEPTQNSEKIKLPENNILVESLMSGKTIPDMTASHVTHLDLSGTSIKNLRTLRNFVNLIYLNISFTDIRSLNGIEKLPKLCHLNARMTKISIVPLNFCPPSLEYLSLSGTLVKSLGALSKLPSLEELDISYTQIDQIGNLRDAAELKALDLSFTQVYTLEPLIGHSTLQEIYVTGLADGIEQRMEAITDVLVVRHDTSISANSM